MPKIIIVDKIDKVMQYIGIGGLLVACFCQGWTLGLFKQNKD